jgi:hypothetical protein
MSGTKGHPKTGGGSRKGVPNKTTQNAREAIAMLVENNIPRMQGWLDAIAEKDGPAAAWRCLQDVVEYHIPKLQRTEHANADGEPFVIEITRFSDALKAPGK